MRSMRIVTVVPGALLDSTYAEVIAPSFAPNELSDVEDLRDGVSAGCVNILAALGEDDRPDGVAVGDWWAGTRVALLSYLAVRPGVRSTGVGGGLLTHALVAWRQLWQPDLMLAEIEHPAAHPAHGYYGDPEARVRFYARYGVRPLQLPYFQPALRAGFDRAYGLMLCLFATDARVSTVDGGVLRRWFTEYLDGTEGSVRDDRATRILLAAMAGDVPVLSLDDLDAVPVSGP
jgi:GNAT superfamily N-acetyltransferase